MALALSTAPAWAQSKAGAEALFEEGRRLMAEDKAEEACPKFADSHKLDPASGTLLNLANCYEKTGRLASAWATYQEAASLADSTGKTQHSKVAQKRAAALEPRLSRVMVIVPKPVPGLEITRDGTPVTASEWGLPIPIDSGDHTIKATAPHYKPLTDTLHVEGEGATSKYTLPELEKAPEEERKTSVESPATEPKANATPPVVARSTAGRDQRIVGLVLGGVGVVGLGVGSIFALTAKSKYDSSLALCSPGDRNLCSPQGLDERNSARTAGDAASLTFGLGAAVLVAGAALWFTAPREEKSSTTLRLAPTLGGGALYGTW